MSRRAEIERDDREVTYPDCRAYYIIEYLSELGVTLGENALTHSEIQAWMQNSGINLSAFEARSIKRLSAAYLNESKVAGDIDADSAWIDAPYYMTAKWRKAMRIKRSIRQAAEV